MFVEHLTWTVPGQQRENAVNMLSLLHHYMDASGGLIKALAGSELGYDEHLASITFWKSWEDLARFLGSAKASLLSQVKGAQAAGPRPHHFEVIWEWPGEEVDTASGETLWSIEELYVQAGEQESLFETLKHSIQELGRTDGFRCAGLWLDRNNSEHLAVAAQWLGDPLKQALPAETAARPGLKIDRRTVMRLRVSDPYHVVSR